MAKFTDLTPLAGSSINNNYVFAVSTASETRSLTLDELEKSFTGITAKSTDGISVFGNTVPSGITVGDNGFVGIDNENPLLSLHIGDYNGVTHPEFRISGALSSRSVSSTISDSGVYWKTTKKASDKDYYLQVSEDDSNYTGVLNIDISGNVGLFDGGSDIPSKFFVSGGDVKFQNNISGIIFRPDEAEIKTSVNTDVFYINKSNTDDVVLGNNVLYVTNNPSSPAVGINSTSPSATLEVVGANTILNIENTSTNRSRLRLGNNVTTNWWVLEGTKLNIGPVSVNSSSNLIYDVSTKKLGLGVSSVDNKLHVYSNTESRLTKFETKTSSLSEVFQVNNYNDDEVSYTGPRHTIYAFGRSVGESSFTNNQSKWGIGLYDDGSTDSYEDVFVFRQDADTSSTSSIKAYLDTDGNFDIKGSFSTSGDYLKGKFVQSYQSSVTGRDQYFSPFANFSSEIASGVSGGRPFSITPHSGQIKEIKLSSFTENVYSYLSGSGYRFEIYVADPASGVVDGYASGFEPSPSTSISSFPRSGIVAAFALDTILDSARVYNFPDSVFDGAASFGENKYLQYRICDSTGAKPTGIDFDIVSVVSYNIV